MHPVEAAKNGTLTTCTPHVWDEELVMKVCTSIPCAMAFLIFRSRREITSGEGTSMAAARL